MDIINNIAPQNDGHLDSHFIDRRVPLCGNGTRNHSLKEERIQADTDHDLEGSEFR